MKKKQNFEYYDNLINKIQNTRKKNNKNWMDLMKIAFKYKPDETKIVVKKIFSEDMKINKLIQKLVK
tara:strand:+ start:192 stop:392 length:201 start_codon:yes stop_codon:yes gene_type:complete